MDNIIYNKIFERELLGCNWSVELKNDSIPYYFYDLVMTIFDTMTTKYEFHTEILCVFCVTFVVQLKAFRLTCFVYA